MAKDTLTDSAQPNADDDGHVVTLILNFEGISFHAHCGKSEDEFPRLLKTREPCGVCAAESDFKHDNIAEDRQDWIKIALCGCAISVQRVVWILQISRSKLYRLVKDGKLKKVTAAGRSFISVNSIKTLLGSDTDIRVSLRDKNGKPRLPPIL